jgi:HprK-related kinase B
MSDERGTTAELAADWARRYPATETLRLRFDTCGVRVVTNSAAVREGLAAYYRNFADAAAGDDIVVAVHEAPAEPGDLELIVCPPEPGKERVKDEYRDLADGRLLRKRLTEMVFVFGGPAAATIGPCLANLNQVINFINNRFMQWHVDRGALLAHAAGVALHGRGLALAGLASRGKSTLTLHLLGKGLDYVTNDRLLLTRTAGGGLRMLGLPKFPRVNPGTLLNNERLAGLLPAGERAKLAGKSRAELWGIEQKYDVDVNEFFAGRFALGADVGAVAVLNWRLEGGAARVAPVKLAERPELLGALRKSPGVHYYPGAGRERPDCSGAAYLERLGDVTVLEIGGGVDFEAAAAACVGWLG